MAGPATAPPNAAAAASDRSPVAQEWLPASTATWTEVARPPRRFESSTRRPSTGSSGRWVVAGLNNAVELAELAMEETGFGVFEDKVVKNYIASEFLYDYLKDKRSVGVIDEDPSAASSTWPSRSA
jgi:acetaldehyde dehydrogenase/alcohol dehydrogenase